MKVLLLENIHPIAKNSLEDQGFTVDLLDYSPAPSDMEKLFSDYKILGIRSKTKLTKEVLQASRHLYGIGCFCIGTNQVDLLEAKKQGIAVFNAPHSNTRSVAELVICEMVMLARQLGDKNTNAHQGRWSKSAKGSNEIRGKTLGIVGYGHIGSQVSVLAEAFGLKVIFYDVFKKLPLGNATQVESLNTLLEESDFVTLHVPETHETKDMIGKKELSLMKKTSHLINASRGSVVEINSLTQALNEGRIAGAAVDVFPQEPASNDELFKSELQGLQNVVLTPHIGGSTEEAQVSIGQEVAESLNRFIKEGSTSGSVNFPEVHAPLRDMTTRIVNIHKNEPGVLGEINNLISNTGVNIEAQHLATDDEIGYLVIDVKSDNADELADKIKELKRSTLTRVIYNK